MIVQFDVFHHTIHYYFIVFPVYRSMIAASPRTATTYRRVCELRGWGSLMTGNISCQMPKCRLLRLQLKIIIIFSSHRVSAHFEHIPLLISIEFKEEGEDEVLSKPHKLYRLA